MTREREKHSVVRVRRLRRVRNVRCLRSIFCIVGFPTVCCANGGRVCYLLIKEKVVIVEPEGGTDDGRGSRKMSTLSE